VNACDNIITPFIQEVAQDPKTLAEAQAHKDWPHWKEAMDCEIATLNHTGTWSNVQ